MCARCHMNAALPDSDLCASCLAEVGQVIEFTHRLKQIKPDCMFGTPWCHGPEFSPCCADCAEFGPKAAA